MNPRLKQQRYCKRAECQRVRKRKWQRMKMAADPDYQSNQRDAQQQWRERNPDYWRLYRSRRIRSQTPAAANLSSDGAKMDTLSPDSFIFSGDYMLVPILSSGAKMDALKVKIVPISKGCTAAKKDSIGFHPAPG
jgi:hypothetical protein